MEAVLHLIRNLESQVKVIEQLSECSYERGIEHSGYLISSYFTTLKECCELLRQSWYAKWSAEEACAVQRLCEENF